MAKFEQKSRRPRNNRQHSETENPISIGGAGPSTRRNPVSSSADNTLDDIDQVLAANNAANHGMTGRNGNHAPTSNSPGSFNPTLDENRSLAYRDKPIGRGDFSDDYIDPNRTDAAAQLARAERRVRDDKSGFEHDYIDPNRTDAAAQLARAEKDIRGINYTPPVQQEQASTKNPLGRLFSTKKRKALIGGGAGGILAIILGVGTLSPFGAFLQLKEAYSAWADKFDTSAHMHRAPRVKAERYFTDPSSCGAVKVMCKLKSGISDKEIAKLREAGVTIDEKDIAKTADGKKYLKSMSVDDGKGGKIKMSSAKEFTQSYMTNPRVFGAFEKVTSVRGIVWRGKQAIKKFREFSVNRKNPIGNESDKEKITEDMRRQIYEEGDPNGLDADKPASQEELDKINEEGNSGKLAGLGDLDAEILNQANEVKKDLITKGPSPSSVLNTSFLDTLDLKTLKKVIGDSLQSSGKGAVMGLFAKIDSTCTFVQSLRVISYGAKVYKAAALIKYAGLFMTLADAAKAGQITAAQAAYIVTILITPSHADGSKGKTFADSEGFTLITQGRIGSRANLARFNNGTPASRVIDKVKSFISLGGGSAATCSKVKSWWGQTGLLLGGIVTSILTGGGGVIAGATIGAAEGALLSLLGAYITPILISYAAGSVVPDPLTDPEGGYGAGNAIAAGIGAFGSQVGRGNGLAPTKKAEFAAVNAEATINNNMIAKAEQLNSNESVFVVARDKLTMSLLPITSAISSFNAGALMSSTMQLIGAAPSTAFGTLSPAYAANAVDYYRGEMCNDDDYKAMDLATDAFCNPIYSQTVTDLDSIEYSPEAVINYMVNNGHVDADGNAQSDDFKDFLENCIDGSIPLTSDGYDPDLGNKSKYCASKDEKYQFFRFYVMDQNIIDADDSAVNNKLGVDEGEDTAPTDTTGTPPPTSSAGWAWPIQQDLKPGPCWNVQVGSLGAHAGMDINTDNASNVVHAMHDGTITSAAFDTYGGNMVQMKTTDGIYVTMQHMSSMAVKAGQTVKVGDKIGIAGKTGRVFASSAAHFHFTVSHSAAVPSYGSLKESFDPLDILPKPAPDGYTCTGR